MNSNKIRMNSHLYLFVLNVSFFIHSYFAVCKWQVYVKILKLKDDNYTDNDKNPKNRSKYKRVAEPTSHL